MLLSLGMSRRFGNAWLWLACLLASVSWNGKRVAGLNFTALSAQEQRFVTRNMDPDTVLFLQLLRAESPEAFVNKTVAQRRQFPQGHATLTSTTNLNPQPVAFGEERTAAMS